MVLSANVLSLTDLPAIPWVAAGLSLIYAVVAARSRGNYLGLLEIEVQPKPEQPPDCMVVIPARNEEANIARAIKSLPQDAVIVVDDDSSDHTAEAARAAGAGVIPAPKLPRGAVGKSNACAEGARVLTSKWILFADADTWFEEGFLESVVAAAEAGRLDFLSIYLRPVHETTEERILSPFAEALYFFGLNPRANGAHGFNGQCVLARRASYEFVGGHGAVLSDLFEDVKLAARALRHRMNFSVARAYYLGRVRIPPTMFRRNAYRFTVVSPWMGISIMIAALLFALWLPVLIWLLAAKQTLAAVVFALWPAFLMGGWYQSYLWSMLTPLAIYGVLPSLIGGFFSALAGRRLNWKGRVI